MLLCDADSHTAVPRDIPSEGFVRSSEMLTAKKLSEDAFISIISTKLDAVDPVLSNTNEMRYAVVFL